jgi:hypothetical protein
VWRPLAAAEAARRGDLDRTAEGLRGAAVEVGQRLGDRVRHRRQPGGGRAGAFTVVGRELGGEPGPVRIPVDPVQVEAV